MNPNLQTLYKRRYEGELAERNRIWRILCMHFFQRLVNKTDTVLDLGAGYCEFINNIVCAHKYAVDLNNDVSKFAAKDIIVSNKPISELTKELKESIDVVFMSNFLEHLKSKEEVLAVLADIHNILKPDGKIMIMQPNIRYAFKGYWDFFDHNIPLSEKSVCEALILSGFTAERIIPKFLPYSIKSRLPRHSFLVYLYLKLPLLWRIFGKQMFIIARVQK